jgi:nucleoside-diphosphate-sugar epimerase
VVVRPFNTYGPHQSARAIIPTIVTQALTGDTVRLGSLHPRRDMTFVSDTVAGFLAAATGSDAALGQTIQLGTGEDVSVGEMVEAVGRLLGKQLNVETDPARIRPAASEVERLISDPARAAELLGWKPSVSLEDGLRATIAWIEENAARYRVGEYVV